MDIFRNLSDTKAQIDKICRIPLTAEEKEFCKQVRQPPKMSDITWRIFRIMAEFVDGFQFLSGTTREVTIFGSARTPASNRWYEEARKLGFMLGKDGYTVVTGGGPGIMEAANRGAYEAGAMSVGLNIQLPKEQRINPYVTHSKAFYYFFTRKVMLAASAQSYIYFPGGYGTLDEFSEIIVLIQTGKLEPIPIVLVGKSFWEPLIAWFEEVVYGQFDGIERKDLKLFTVVDTAEEAYNVVVKSKERSFF